MCDSRVREKTVRSYFNRVDYYKREVQGAATGENKETSSGIDVKNGGWEPGNPGLEKVLSINYVTLDKYFSSLCLNFPSRKTRKSARIYKILNPLLGLPNTPRKS